MIAETHPAAGQLDKPFRQIQRIAHCWGTIGIMAAFAIRSSGADSKLLQSPEAPLVPLAYVRTLSVAPVVLMTPADPPLPVEPARTDKKRTAQWKARRKAREAMVRQRQSALTAFSAALQTRLSMDTAIRLESATAESISGDMVAALRDSIRSSNPKEELHSETRAKLAAKMAQVALAQHSDAFLLVTVDRFGTNKGIEKELWIRSTTWLCTPGGSRGPELNGPFFALGRSSTGRKLVGKGFAREDESLAREAADQAAKRLVNTLRTGSTTLFSENCRCAIVPAHLPATLAKRYEMTDEHVNGTASNNTSINTSHDNGTGNVALSSVFRQRDVLFQPESSPVTEISDRRDVEQALSSLSLQPGDFWEDGGVPSISRLQALAAILRCDYIFVSRVVGIDLVESPVVANDLGQPKAGVARSAEAEVEGLLFSARKAMVLWRDKLTGGTIARTEYVRHRPRIRTDEQCVADAVITAYAYLRSSFKEYRRKLDQDLKP